MKKSANDKILKDSVNVKIDRILYDKLNKLITKRQIFEEKNDKLTAKKVTSTKAIEEAMSYFIEMDINPVEFKRNEHTKMLKNLDNNMFKLRDNIFSFMQVQEKKMLDKFNSYDKYFKENMKLYEFANQRHILTHELLISLIEYEIEDKKEVNEISKRYKTRLDKAKELLK